MPAPSASDLDAASSFARDLGEELTLVQQFVDVLAREQRVLTDGNSDDLPGYAEQKSQLAVRLNALAEQRNAALATHGLSKDRLGMAAWCAAHPEQTTAAARWAQILALAGQARELNRVNGELIQMRLQYNAQALEALQGGRDALDLYGPDGQAKTQGNPRIDDSV
ncbi:MAG: flagellar protein FlgN [Propionivibrio sp.]